MNGQNGRKGVIEVITSPLGFYVLALLIVESFLGLVGINSDMYIKYTCIGIGTFLFISVIWVVTFLVIKCPRNLTFGGKEHIRQEEISYGTKEKEVRKKDIDRIPLSSSSSSSSSSRQRKVSDL